MEELSDATYANQEELRFRTAARTWAMLYYRAVNLLALPAVAALSWNRIESTGLFIAILALALSQNMFFLALHFVSHQWLDYWWPVLLSDAILYICLSALSGGLDSNFIYFFFLLILSSSVRFERRASLNTGAVSALCVCFLFFYNSAGDWSDLSRLAVLVLILFGAAVATAEIGHLITVARNRMLEATTGLIRANKKIVAQATKISESEHHLRQLVETTSATPWEWDAEQARFTYVGPQVEGLLGVTPGEWLERDVWRSLIHPDERERVCEQRRSAIAKLEDQELEYRMLTRDGDTVWVRDNFSVVNHPGEPVHLRGFLFNVTARNKAEEELHRYRDHLEELVADRTAEVQAVNKELEAFSYSVSHDLRAPLRSIDGFSQALLEDYGDELDDTGKHYLERMRKAAQKMGRLIDDMLALSRVNRRPLNPQTVSLSSMALEILAEMRDQNPGRTVDYFVQDNLTACCDTHLMRIALCNLLGNAWKYTSKTKNARIDFSGEENDGDLVFCIKDNGAGFDMRYANKLFGTFERLHGNGEFEGTGIGLATVKRVLDRHNGRVWGEGAVGEGASFYFSLPAPRK